MQFSHCALYLRVFSGQSSVTELYVEYSETYSTLSCTWPKHETIMIYCEITHKDGDSSEKVTSDIAKVSVNTCELCIFLWICTVR